MWRLRLWMALKGQSTNGRLEQKVNRLEYMLGLLLEAAEVEVPSQLSAKVQQLALDPARKIEAIRLYRQETKLGLRDAKEDIERFIARAAQAAENTPGE